jgi:hypothetical protein
MDLGSKPKQYSGPVAIMCAEKEVESIARDTGISASDFRALVSLGPNASDLLERRMALLDLDPVEVSEIAPQTFRDLQRVCSFCQSHRRCRRDLARDLGKPEWKDYCPNVETLMRHQSPNTLPAHS